MSVIAVIVGFYAVIDGGADAIDTQYGATIAMLVDVHL